jgi:hypothetical protein
VNGDNGESAYGKGAEVLYFDGHGEEAKTRIGKFAQPAEVFDDRNAMGQKD